MKKSVKPIFHQNAKYLVSGVGVGQCTRRQNFAPEFCAKYTNMLVYFVLGNAHFSRFIRRVLPDTFYPMRFTRRQSMEYRWRCAFWRWGWCWSCTFHIFCVDFICIWWSTQSQYPVECGLKFWNCSVNMGYNIGKCQSV